MAKAGHQYLLDMRTMQAVATFGVVNDPDVLDWDDHLGLLYVASESGVVSLFKVSDRTVEKLGEGRLRSNAYAVVVNEHTHRAYFPLKSLNGKPVLNITRPMLSTKDGDDSHGL